MLILGLIKPEEAKAFLINDVALSESDAREELERCTYRAPGQAAAYVYGYMTLSDLSERIRLAGILGPLGVLWSIVGGFRLFVETGRPRLGP